MTSLLEILAHKPPFWRLPEPRHRLTDDVGVGDEGAEGVGHAARTLDSEAEASGVGGSPSGKTTSSAVTSTPAAFALSMTSGCF